MIENYAFACHCSYSNGRGLKFGENYSFIEANECHMASLI